MSLNIEPIPDGFLGKVLNEFGIQWTHLVILSGVVFSSFGLQTYIESSIWILGVVSSFSFVYFFRNYISDNFLKTSIICLLAFIIGLTVLTIIISLNENEPSNFFIIYQKSSTLYLSLLFGIPLGVMILSYKKQDDFNRQPLPLPIKQAILSISHSDFILQSVNYVIELIKLDNNEVLFKFNVAMTVYNRSNNVALYQDYFDPAGKNEKFVSADLNGIPVNILDPERNTKRGLLMFHRAESGESFKISVAAESTYTEKGNEVVGVYLPCNYLSMRVINHNKDLLIHIQSQLPNKTEAKKLETGDLLFEYSNGILPFQGTRIYWELRN